ncbi:MAG: AraC family transcriptional regulator [Victivallales bacterium]|nr:AraC family transcriptional regulator [Victivallales bacterium]
MTNRTDNQGNGEANYSPIPAGMAKQIIRSGLQIVIYYERVRSEAKPNAPARSFPFYGLAHLIDGDGFYYDGDTGTTVPLEPGDGVLISPGKRHEYGGRERYFLEDAISFVGPTADALYQAGIITDGVLRIGTERRLLPLILKLRDPSLVSQFEANVMLQQLLLNLFRENRRHDSAPHRKLQQLLHELNAMPHHWWTVAEMADYCNLSTNHLRTLFHNATGMGPKQYFDRLKMSKAAEMLCATRMKLPEIAAYLGYTDQYHFMRRFSAIFGMPPVKYRKTYAKISPGSPPVPGPQQSVQGAP